MIRILVTMLMLLCPALVLASPYFPPHTWYNGQGAWTPDQSDAFFESWYGGQLKAMEEVPLWSEDEARVAQPTLRLLFLPTFDHGAMVRVYQGEDRTMHFVFKLLTGAGGYEPGGLARTIRGRLDPEQRQEVIELIKRINPFDPGTLAELRATDAVCFDGTTVVLEVTESADYAAISRHECELPGGDPVRELVVLLNKVSGNRMIAPDTFEERDF